MGSFYRPHILLQLTFFHLRIYISQAGLRFTFFHLSIYSTQIGLRLTFLIIADIKYLLLLYSLYTLFIIFSSHFLKFSALNLKTFQPDHLYPTISVSGKHYICPPTHLFVASRFASNICSPVHLYFTNRVVNNI